VTRVPLSRFFIERPVFATVLSIVIVLAGLVSAMILPVAQYPEIAPPTVTNTATYPGATAETLARTVAAPIEVCDQNLRRARPHAIDRREEVVAVAQEHREISRRDALRIGEIARRGRIPRCVSLDILERPAQIAIVLLRVGGGDQSIERRLNVGGFRVDGATRSRRVRLGEDA
jgi:hypothetical protein